MSERKEIYKTSLVKANEAFLPQIESQITDNGITMDQYSKSCVLNAISAINTTLDTSGVKWDDPQLDQSNLTQTLLHVASLKLNASANPNEVYFTIRNVRINPPQGEAYFKKKIEMGVEGDGNDAILSNFGRGVEEVRQHWLVREHDDFQYPSFNGLDMEPPKWTPKGSGKVVRVVYPIIKKGGAYEFHIAEREDVIKNLLAHINNNLMWEKFGIPKNYKNPTPAEKKKIREKKDEILNRAEELGLDGALKDETIQDYISPAWKSPQSRESMLVRKMRNNIVKKIPKDFGSALAALSFDDATNEQQEHTRKEVNDYANNEIIDIDTDSTTDNESNTDSASDSEVESEIIDQKENEEKEKDEPVEDQPKDTKKKDDVPF